MYIHLVLLLWWLLCGSGFTMVVRSMNLSTSGACKLWLCSINSLVRSRMGVLIGWCFPQSHHLFQGQLSFSRQIHLLWVVLQLDLASTYCIAVCDWTEYIYILYIAKQALNHRLCQLYTYVYICIYHYRPGLSHCMLCNTHLLWVYVYSCSVMYKRRLTIIVVMIAHIYGIHIDCGSSIDHILP